LVGGVFAFVTGLPVSLFNGCVVGEPAAREQLAEAVGWVTARSVPYRIWIAERLLGDLGDVPRRLGIGAGPEPYPNMVLHPVPAPPAPAAGVTVASVDEPGLDEFVDVSVDIGLPRELAADVFSPDLAADPDVRLFTGRLGREAVGTALAIRTGDVSGVYNVSVVPRARRRGVGAALTWAAVAAGRAWGCDPIVLQASAMGLSLYRAMGFRTVKPYAMFTQKTAS
jgi:GNAT superfamily N-acetyltransferase